MQKYPKKYKKIFGRRTLIALMILVQIVLVSVMIFSSYQLGWLSILLTALSVVTALHLLSSSDKSAFKISLVFLILLVPLFGGAFYWVFHFQTGSHGFRKRLKKISQKQKEQYEPSTDALNRASAELPQDKKLLSYLQNTAAFPVYQNTQTRYFPTGKEMLASMLTDLEHAERYIFMEYFIIEEGVMWDSILEVLKKKAAAGLDVRIIYDDMGSLLKLPAGYAKELQSYGIKCKVFNPFHPFLTSLQNNRDHRKIAVIDGKIAYTGGINFADEYIGEIIRFGNWKDTAIRLCGNGAESFTIMFLQMWSLLTGQEEIPGNYLPSPKFAAVSDGWVQPYSDSPMDRENVGEHVYLHAIDRTQRYLYITTPYFMVGDEMIAALKYCAKSGVDVRIITPGVPDKRMVHFTTRSYYRELIRAGVKIYEYSEGFMHAKICVSDGELATVGTVNMDYRSLYLHYECGVCLYRADTIAAIEKDFLDTLPHCHLVTKEDCKTNLFIRLMQDICRLFAPLM